MDFIFYRDLNGRPRLRRFAAAALALLTVLVGLALLVAAQAGPGPVPSGRAHAGPIVLVQPEPSPTPSPEPSPTASACSDDPSSWSFVPIFPDDHYHRIEPACVYEGVARTAAWMLLARMGYSKTSAAEILSFKLPPWEPILTIHGYTNLKGPLDLPLLSEWPAHPDFRFWQVDTEGRPALAISLRGCYRRPGQTGGVICVLAMDRSPGTAVSVLGDLAIAHHGLHLPGSRTFHLLNYAGEGRWNLIGQLNGLSLEIEDIDQMAAERVRLTGRLGAVPWDPAWLFSEHGLALNPLPQDWRLYGMDEGTVRSIGQELNRFIPASLQETDE
ncbi:MAG TPA: hypothetical protein VMN57_01420 [Anaerolineales bacterium]|nr:hypothetical protein [Anaerolineales bacterium]